MSDNYNTIIDQDWDELALDDGTIVDEFGSYSATIYPRDGTGADALKSQVEGISYSPEVNSAKGISVDVEPLSALKEEDYLGGIVDVFVNNRPIFSGKIYKISTSSQEGTFYTLEAEPPAKELRNETINESTDNYLLSDYCAKTIDKFNNFDDKHFNLIDTADESLTHINKVGRGREAISDSATVTYSNVGSDASNIDILYVKLLVDGSVDVTIDTANSSYSETFTSSIGTYGDWFKIKPSGLDSEQYDIKYSLDNSSVVYDWISLTGSKITRTVEPEVAEILQEEKTIQDADTDTEFNNILNIQDTDPYKVNNGKIIPLQTSFVDEAENGSAVTVNLIKNGVEYSNGELYGVGGKDVQAGDDSTPPDGFSQTLQAPEYNIENYKLEIRNEFQPEYNKEGSGSITTNTTILEQEDRPYETEVFCENTVTTTSGESATVSIEVRDINGNVLYSDSKTANDDETVTARVDQEQVSSFYELKISHSGDSSADYEYFVRDHSVYLPGFDVTVNGETVETFLDGTRVFAQNIKWNFSKKGNETLSAGNNINIELNVTSASSDFSDKNADNYGFINWDVVSVVDDRYEYFFDNKVNVDNGYLDGPELYPKQKQNFPRLEINEVSLGEVIEKGYLDITTNDSNGLREIGISFDGGNSFRTSNNANSVVKENIGLTASIIGRLGTVGWEENGPRDQTPRLGYTPQKIDLYDLAVDTNNIEILFNKDISGNRLKVITDIIDNSRLYYRVEGGDIRIFRRGDKKTNVDLRKEDVNSSASIGDVYSSCEVIGDNVTSGVFEASDAPDYVDKHKEIRDPDITNKDDARRRARSFLEENSTIEYEGDITTLPTLAPLGEEIDGSIFSHGKDSFIESVRYGKRRTSIDVGRTKQLQDELLNLDRSTSSTNTRNTSI
jgi:hypothetical protein